METIRVLFLIYVCGICIVYIQPRKLTDKSSYELELRTNNNANARLKKEMEAFDDIFQKINNSGIEHVQKIEIISLLKGKLEMLARKAINVDEMIDARGDVSKEKLSSDRLARRHCVKSRIKFAIDLILDIHSADAAIRRMEEINAELVRIFNPDLRINYLTDCVTQLQSLVLKNSSDFYSEFPNVLKKLKNSNFDLNGELQTPTPFQTALLQLYISENETEAKQLWYEQLATVWRPRTEKLLINDTQEISDLCQLGASVNPRIWHYIPEDVLKTRSEREYAIDAVRIGKIFTNSKMPKYYKLCLWRVNHLDNDRMRKVSWVVLLKWSGYLDFEIHNIFCTKLNQLHDLVASDFPSGLPTQYSKLTDVDFDEYYNHLALNYGEKMSFVANTVTSISSSSI